MEGMKYFLICTNFENRTEFMGFWADDEDHALEQLDLCCDEYNPSQYVTHVFVSDTEINNTVLFKGIAEINADLQARKDREHDAYCERQDWLESLKVGDMVILEPYQDVCEITKIKRAGLVSELNEYELKSLSKNTHCNAEAYEIEPVPEDHPDFVNGEYIG
jgi:hypothetical protein